MTGTTAYYCKQQQCQHARSQLHKQTLFEEERRPDEVIAEPLPQLQCIAPRQCRHCVPATRRSALAFCTKWNYCCGLDVEAFSTVLHCWLRPCPRQDHLQLGCSEVWASNRRWHREEDIASERSCVCAEHPSQVKIYETHWLVEDLTYLFGGLLNQLICLPNQTSV